MNPRPLLSVVIACLPFAGAVRAADAVPGCLPTAAVTINVRMGDAPPVAAQLVGGFETPLSVVEPTSRRVLWSAGMRNSATQVFPDMSAAFAGSLTAIDLDADGLHDRIYAGDLAGRLWRFDLHHGAPAATWASGGLFADFGNDEGRGFLAAPDVSLTAPRGMPPWLNIAIGTAAPGNAAANNRFYALRDHAVYDAWTDEDYEDWSPLREDDLRRVEATVQATTDAVALVPPTSPGWYVELGSGHVVTPTITVDNRAVLAIAATLPGESGPCEVLTRIANFDLQRQVIVPVAATGDWHMPVPAPVPVSASFSFNTGDDAIPACMLAGQHIAACDVDTRPRKTWWRRGDAE